MVVKLRTRVDELLSTLQSLNEEKMVFDQYFLKWFLRFLSSNILTYVKVTSNNPFRLTNAT